MRARLPFLCLVALSSVEPAQAQRADALGPEVRKYLRVSTPRVVLEHVQVVDGTGAAPSPDRNILIVEGKIAAISAGADQPPSEGTTVLDLRGHTVVPGIVGMHDHLYCLVQPDLKPDSARSSSWSRPDFRRSRPSASRL
jgi:hypothetical protein